MTMVMQSEVVVADPVAERHWICARRLRERRRQLALTQAALVGRLSHRGVPLTNRTLSAMENGRGLDLGRLPDLAAVLSCSVTYLLGLTGDPHRWEPDAPLVAQPPDPPSGTPPPGSPSTAPSAVDQPTAPLPRTPAPSAPIPTGAAVPPGDPVPTARHNWILGPDPLLDPDPDRGTPRS
jgi:hypothetical protein